MTFERNKFWIPPDILFCDSYKRFFWSIFHEFLSGTFQDIFPAIPSEGPMDQGLFSPDSRLVFTLELLFNKICWTPSESFPIFLHWRFWRIVWDYSESTCWNFSWLFSLPFRNIHRFIFLNFFRFSISDFLSTFIWDSPRFPIQISQIDFPYIASGTFYRYSFRRPFSHSSTSSSKFL